MRATDWWHQPGRQLQASLPGEFDRHDTRGSVARVSESRLLYLADRDAVLRWGRPITFDWYFSLPHGPVLSFTLDRINDERDPDAPSYWHRFISERQGNEVSLLQDAPGDALSAAEQNLLRETFDRFGKMSQWQLRDFSHRLPEGRDPQGSRLPIEIRDILLAEGRSLEDVEDIEDALGAEASPHEILG